MHQEALGAAEDGEAARLVVGARMLLRDAEELVASPAAPAVPLSGEPNATLDCTTLPRLPASVLAAEETWQITAAQLVRLSVWFGAPLLFMAVSGTREGGLVRDIVIREVQPFLDRVVCVVADGQRLWQYASEKHKNSLSGKPISYFATHAFRFVSPTTSFHVEAVNLPTGPGADAQLILPTGGVAAFLKEKLVGERVGGSVEGTAEGGRAWPFRMDGFRLDRIGARAADGDSKAASSSPPPTPPSAPPQPRLPPRPTSKKKVKLQVDTVDPKFAAQHYFEVPRESNLSPLDFVHRYLLVGNPLVVTDAMQNWTALGKWTMEWMFKKHIGSMRKDAEGEDNLNPTPDTAGKWLVKSAKTSKLLRRDYSVPYFLDLGTPGEAAGRDSASNVSAAPHLHAEMLYYSPSTAYATTQHLDTNCAQSWSAQLQGRKQWLLWPPKGTTKWKPMATILEPGDVIVFYSGWAHEARNVEDAPSLSLSQFFASPAPSTFLWEHRELLIKCPWYKVCGTTWELQTGRPFSSVRPEGIGKDVPACR